MIFFTEVTIIQGYFDSFLDVSAPSQEMVRLKWENSSQLLQMDSCLSNGHGI